MRFGCQNYYTQKLKTNFNLLLVNCYVRFMYKICLHFILMGLLYEAPLRLYNCTVTALFQSLNVTFADTA